MALGPTTAAKIHAHVGDKVAAGRSGQRMKVVGITLVAQTPHSSFDEGALLTPIGFHAAVGDATARMKRSSACAQGRPSTAVLTDLTAKGFARFTARSSHRMSPTSPTCAACPLWLAAFLVLLAIGAVAHALLTGAPSRRHDLAVLRALGLTPRQAAACVVWQAAVIGAIALIVGIPLGIAVGRQVWRLLADSLSFVYVGPLAGLLLLALVPIALGVLALLAVWPARGAARLNTAGVLHAE